MTSSFTINQADLTKILQQIKVAETHASGNKSLLQVIMETYGISAAEAALLPVGLRTVTGVDNNLIPGQSMFGAADTLFPRLTDPRFLNDADGDKMALGPPGSGAPTITNNNYGLQQSVADADPRIISNLIVDMTPGNPAAVEAALKYLGIVGAAAVAPRDAIVAAYRNIAATATAAKLAQDLENSTQATLTTETSEQATAATNNTAAQATLTAYNNAVAADADTETSQAKAAVVSLVGSLGAVGSTVNQADRDAAAEAVLQATQARNAAQTTAEALLADLPANHPNVVAAQGVLTNAQTLLTNLLSLQAALASTTPNLDAPEFTLAAAANTGAGTTAGAADANTTQLTTSQGIAQTAATTTAANLATANITLASATTAKTQAVDASNAADGALIAAQETLALRQADVVAAQGVVTSAAAAHAPHSSTIAAYDTAISKNVAGSFSGALLSTTNAVLTALGDAGSPIDLNDAPGADSDLNAVQAAITTASQLSARASEAVTALEGGPLVVAADLAAAQLDAAHAADILARLNTLLADLQADPNQLLDPADVELAIAIRDDTDAFGQAAANFTGSRATALANGGPTQTALNNANDALGNANIAVNGIEETILGVLDPLTGNRTGGLQPDADAKNLVETAAITAFNTATADQLAADVTNTAAQATLTAYTSALADDVEVAAHLTQTNAAALVASLGAQGSAIDAADLAAADAASSAAQAAVTASTHAANTLLVNLGATHADVVAAQLVADGAVAVRNQLVSLKSALLSSSPLVDQAEFDAAAAAQTLATGNETQANGVDAQLTDSQGTAGSAAAGTAAALTQANAELAAATTAHNSAVTASDAADVAREAARPHFNDVIDGYEVKVQGLDSLVIPNVSPDIGLSPGFNSWMTFFGQFFDHGLDLVTKGNNGTVYVPLQADDPLIAGADGVVGTADDLPAGLRFMALTRATVTLDANGVPQNENTTTAFIDQNQTYTSHPSHQVFLREYQRVGNQTLATGHLLDGTTASGSLNGAIANWGEIKQQALTLLGLKLDDFDIGNVPLLATDQYGKFIPGANGYAQLVMPPDGSHATNWLQEGTAAGLSIPANALRTNHAFLNDIAHHAAPTLVDADHNPATPKTRQLADTDIDANHNGVYDAGDTLTDVNHDGVVNTADFFADDGSDSTYDDEMLASHFITGDGRGNENIALTSVHSVFHSEHNRAVEVDKLTILQSGDLTFINEWLRTDITAADLAANSGNLAAYAQTLTQSNAWDGERLFQAARFTTEMQYQHLVFEEFARRIQPNVDPFAFNNNPNIDPSIVAEFAHTVYRFGHSMLTGTVDRLENDLTTVNGDASQETLLAAFLNPQKYVNSGATLEEAQANLIRGLSRDLGNEIDEFIVQDVRSNLLGLPLDLAALNIARGRDTGIPSLNETRNQLHNAGAIDLIPYTGWLDFSHNIKNPISVVNFIAAYGTHASLTAPGLTALQMRDAAMLLVFGDGNNADGVTIRGTTYGNDDRLDFMNGVGAYAASKGGMDSVDLWIGGLAESKNEFGGMLGSTFNYVFEYQMEQLQFGDRMYYLSRTQGMNLLNQLEPNTFSDLVMRNSDLGGKYATHLSGALFVTPDIFLEMDRGIAQTDYNGAAAGLDPIYTAADPAPNNGNGVKVERDYTNSVVVDGNHDVGAKLTFHGGQHVVVGGTEGNDEIRTDRGIDTIWGDGGNDYINAGTESDNVFGGEGDDVIENPFGDDVLRGNQGNDVIRAARGINLIFGDQGSDFLQQGQDGGGAIFAGPGNDFVLGSKASDGELLGNEGDDWMEGAGGTEALAGENSELFFNSPIIGHDVLIGGDGAETDYDAESGDDIMTSGSGLQRMNGMFGFDWGIAKNDITAVNFDLGIPKFVTDPALILRDRFDLVEAASGWKNDDIIIGDSRGHTLGTSAAPGATPTALFIDHVLNADGIARINGLGAVLNGALQTFNLGTTFRDGNILLGGDGNDTFMGKGGYDVIDGDAWLNVRIKIDVGGTIYSAESLNTDTRVAGPFAGKVFNTDANGDPIFTSPAFGGATLQSLLLNRTINPGQMSIVREILQDTTPGDTDTARFQGTLAEYKIEGRGILVDLNNDGVLTGAELIAQRAYDVNGDGFISVTDRDNGVVGALIDAATGRPTPTRGALTDDTDLLKNIEQLAFTDQTIAIAGNNAAATGTVTIGDPTLFSTTVAPLRGGPVTSGVTPYVGQVLTPTLAAGFADANGIPLGANGLPVGLTFEWEASPLGKQEWQKVQITGDSYTVRPFDVGLHLRAVAIFKDANGVTERIYSAATDAPTTPLNIDENSTTGAVVGLIPSFGVAAETQVINAAFTAGGRFNVVQNGIDANGNGIFQVVVANGGPVSLDYEAVQAPVDNQFQIVVDTFDSANTLIAQRQFTIMLNDVVNEGVPTDIIWSGVTPPDNALPAVGATLGNLSSVDPSVGATHTYQLLAGSSAGFTVGSTGVVTANSAMAQNATYTLNVRTTDDTNLTFDEKFTIRTLQSGVNNAFTGTNGDDIVFGLSGADTLNGGSGDDNLYGQQGADILNGDGGNDFLSGGSGADTLNGGAGTDTALFTNTGVSATFAYNVATSVLSVNAGAGTDQLTAVERLRFTDTTVGIVVGTAAADTFLATQGSPNLFLGLGGNDTVSFQNSTVGVTADVVNATLASTHDLFSSIENLTGSAQADALTGDGNANILSGGGGNDTLSGGGGADTLNGGADGDTLNGDAGADTLNGDGGDDTLNGGLANDTLNGGAGADILIGGAGNDTINTGAADDNVRDSIRFTATGDYGDNVSSFDATGTAAQIDRVEFSAALNTAFDDITNNDVFQFTSSNGAAGTTIANINTTAEALLLTGLVGEGVTNANLNNAAAVSGAFNTEFVITGNNGEDALLVVNATDSNNFAVWQWVQAGGGETAAAELTLVGVFNGNADVTTGSFAFV